MTNGITYWFTYAFLQGITSKRKVEIFGEYYKKHLKETENRSDDNIIDLFEDSSLWNDLNLSEQEQESLLSAREDLVNNSFLVEDILAQGYNIIQMTSKEYPKTLKSYLLYKTPIILFTKGNKALLEKKSTAIVGSRNSEPISEEFTRNIARKSVRENKTVVSGFAKGTDRIALEEALNTHGTSIIVLPQGITTFNSGFKQYYRQISEGRVLVVSTFHPKSPWSVPNAMERNHYIYGLGHEIFVAQSDRKGGTWTGVNDAFNRNNKSKDKRPIYIRKPEANEKNANLQLIEKGGIAVDILGNVLVEKNQSTERENAPIDNFDKQAFNLLSTPNTPEYSIKEIKKRLNLDWKENKIRDKLSIMIQQNLLIKIKKGTSNYYKLVSGNEATLFSNQSSSPQASTYLQEKTTLFKKPDSND